MKNAETPDSPDPHSDDPPRVGRPAHVSTPENADKIVLLQGLGWDQERIANALCIDSDTLRKHYYSVLRTRKEQRARLQACLAMRLWKSFIESGNVSALKELRLLFFASPGDEERVTPRLGKKEQALLDAKSPLAGDPLGDLLLQQRLAESGDDD